ncbi:tRNA (adenosine(37)-N6)-dimethylallyltransferase MiaA [Evansella halocellulosilytica]|uniref:tRNA (adenosine(37)-N6)-dimethylallyltransferase MiaA n=1 Tax=Evansella halocellulosilytica TaxID=2011013 RepID=UPI000BB814E2|nr:tRNA (adenosine(37)-N6)-dimethylallyltransferase MiaA [Evansella halocellulosilytica]
MMKKLIVLVGPTAVGKTATSISLAKAFHGEIISGDSMQVYRQMNIGTAKIKQDEMDDIPHHLIDIKDPTENFSVAEFQSKAKKLIDDIHDRNKLPFIVGGTGLYVNSVIYDYDFSSSDSDQTYRMDMENYANTYGEIALHEKLKRIDPDSYLEIHPNNVRRVIRALEVYHVTGKKFSEHNHQSKVSPYDVTVIGLTMERELLYERINKRVDHMIEEGLIEEAKLLYKNGVHHCQSVQAIGYKEIYDYIEGRLSKEDAIETLKQNSRRYAKRQLTWFRNKMNIEWFDMSTDREKKLKEIHEFIEGKLF